MEGAGGGRGTRGGGWGGSGKGAYMPGEWEALEIEQGEDDGEEFPGAGQAGEGESATQRGEQPADLFHFH